MRIAILSDTHDNLLNVRAAVDILRQEDIDKLLHCGDVCGPGVVEALQDFDVFFAQGNMDRMPALGLAVEAFHGPGHLARFHTLMLSGSQAALLHGDEERLLHRLIHSGEYAYVFHGHTHRPADRQIGPTRIINPGALGGLHRAPRSMCIFDLETDQARFIEIPQEPEGER